MRQLYEKFIDHFVLVDYEPFNDGELCELFTHGTPRAMQSIHRDETKRMMTGSEDPVNRKRGKFYTALIFLSGSLLCVSFGSMLGWPSPTYPSLLNPGDPISINIDQSAMIAGMLMNGFVVSTPFAECDCLGSKFGVLLGAALQLSGWLLMIGASDVLGLCSSRILVGLGAGFGIGKFKSYLKEICDAEEGLLLQKILPLFVCLGITISYTIGPFVSFRMLAITMTVIPGLAFLTFIVVPDTPYHLLQQKKVNNAVMVLQNLHGKQCVDVEIQNIKNFVENKPEHKSFYQILKNKYTRKSFVILMFLVTIQQCSGGPSLIVYSQITFTEFNCLYPPICSIIYSLVFLISTGIGTRYTPMIRRKPILLLSLAGCIITSATHAAYLYLKPENKYYSAIPFVTMLLYVFFHTAGVSTITNLVVSDIFPTNSRHIMAIFWNMYSAELAVIITKIYQVLYAQFGMYVGFCLYTCVSMIGFVVILIFLTETKGKLERNRGT